ncbi:TrbC/VIRB2 family protein [uncultured archaeon]|nr:TrbC/VIRB2 family protein [uncultured archaeon]
MKATVLFAATFIVFCFASFAAGAPCSVSGAGPITAAGSTFYDMICDLVEIASALGTLMIAIQGLRWAVADGASERNEAKKGIMYVVIGLALVVNAPTIVDTIYWNNIPPAYKP